MAQRGAGREASGAFPPDPHRPEQVRKKWDALLDVINNIGESTTHGDAKGVGGEAAPGPPLRAGAAAAARDLVDESAARSASAKRLRALPRRKAWDDRHHLVYSVCNNAMQRNVRSYFDRPRDIQSYGQRWDEPLRTTWQLDTPEKPPAKAAGSPQMGGTTSPTSADGAAVMSRSASAPGGRGSTPSSELFAGIGPREDWNSRHSVMFTKDNHHYHGNLRHYFERPRALLY